MAPSSGEGMDMMKDGDEDWTKDMNMDMMNDMMEKMGGIEMSMEDGGMKMSMEGMSVEMSDGPNGGRMIIKMGAAKLAASAAALAAMTLY